jgi:class 3 adenylate cyclase
MRCHSCQSENAAENIYCVECGQALSRHCARCGHAATPTARFCSQCSAALLPDDEPTSHLESRAAIDGERRLVTVLFADLSGSTALIESLDPEQAIKRLSPAIVAMREAVHRFEGSVIKVQGDGIMALFGAPTSQEDHAVRACCAALAMQVAVHALADDALAIRIGLHTGEVLARNISNDLSTGYDAVGITVHIASRMEQMAERGAVLMTEATRRAAQNFIEATALGPLPVKGLSRSLQLYRLTGLRRGPASQRFRGERGLSHFTGRGTELTLLQRALEDAAGGESRVVGVVGEAGVGKSRLCFEFAEQCRHSGVRVLEARALSHTASTPFEPVVDLLRDYFRIAAEDAPQIAREKVALRIRGREAGADEDIALMSDFLGLHDPKIASRVDPMSRRDRLIEMVRRLVRAGAGETTTVIMIEDLHWLDAGSADFLQSVIEAIVGTKALVVVNFRPGYSAPWMSRSYYEQLTLRPLRGAAMDEFIGSLLGHDDSTADLTRHVAERAGGNPFFIEEQIRALVENGYLAGTPGDYKQISAPQKDVIPSTVQAVIGARIDKRPEIERTVLQAAAVIGREFMVDLLERIVEMPAQTIRQALQRLTAAELVYEQGPAATGAYAFKHPLTQEVAYRAQLADKRRAVHAKIAADLEKTLPDASGAHAGFVAYHWEEAENFAQAAQWNVKSAMWHGTRDPAQAFDSWKRVHRLLKAGPPEGPAKYMLMMAAGQLINFAWRIGVTAEEAQPWFDEAVTMARTAGDNRAVTLITAAYGR